MELRDNLPAAEGLTAEAFPFRVAADVDACAIAAFEAAQMGIGDGLIRMSKSSALIVGAGTLLRCSDRPIMLIYLRLDRISDTDARETCCGATGALRSGDYLYTELGYFLRTEFDRLQRYAKMQPEDGAFLNELCAADICLAIADATEAHYAEVGDPRVKRALTFISSNLSVTIRAEDIARAAGVNVSHMYRLFEQSGLPSPIEYILRLRVERAREYLGSTHMTVEGIAHRCGFSSPQYFARAFKAQTGMSPRDYRSQYNFSRSVNPGEVEAEAYD